MKSLDFEIKIGTPQGRAVPVSVLGSPAGEGRGEMTFPYDSLALENRLQGLQLALLSAGPGRRRLVPQHEQAVQSFGAELFDALFAGDIRSMFDRSRQEAVRQSANLRIQLRFDSADMAALPWEFLYDARRAEYLCLSTTTPVVRYVELADPQEPLTVTPPLRLLAMAASPNDLPGLDVAQERHRMEAALGQLAGRFELHWVEGQTWRDLQAALLQGPWHAFHFVGHGGFDANLGEGIIALTDDAGRTHRLCATDLGRLLGDHHHLRLAVLNACEGARADRLDVFSSTAAVLVRRGTPAVVAMQYEITDTAAVELSRSFYGALAAGLPVDGALGVARKSVALAVSGTVEWGTPVLYLRAPDSRIFDIEHTAAPPPPPPPPEPIAPERPERPEPAPGGSRDGGTGDSGRRRKLLLLAGSGAALLLLVVGLAVLLTGGGETKGIGTFDLQVAGGDVATHAVEVPRSSLLLVEVNPDAGFDPDVAVSTDADTSRELARFLRDAGYDRARFRGLFEGYGYDPDGMSVVGRVDEGAAGDQERLLVTAPGGGPFEVVIASADGEPGDVELEVTRVEFSGPDAGDEYIDDLVEASVAEDFLSEEALADLEIWGSIQLGYEEEDDVIDEGEVTELSVVVPASVRWTDTGLDLSIDDEVLITAEGLVQDDVRNNPDQRFAPDGEPDPEGRHTGDPYPDVNHAALVAKISEDGEPFAVGSSHDFVAEEEGRLYFGINDSLLEDNGGEFQAEVEVSTP